MTEYTNRLVKERSPYLLQHAHNPVDWFPWGNEAFEKAKAEDKPVFLSIGYSTCHWCHVMERESFSDPEVGKVMNDVFVCIKVDREERPDVDKIYMDVCQAMTGGGGWPLNMILLPDRRAVFAMTYMPKNSRRGQTGLIEVAISMKELWKEGREKMIEQADRIAEYLQKKTPPEGSELEYEDAMKATFSELSANFDKVNGGFGTRPKFPSPHNILFLLRYYRRFKEPGALEMALQTLRAMRMGGIFDQVGYGFHRYSTDSAWVIPHFEKMLYDQAMLLSAYSEAYLASQDAFYLKVGSQTFAFLMNEMLSPEGLFYTALDADSEGEEGKYYLWRLEEIESLLGPEKAEHFSDAFNCSRTGNFMEEATGRQTGRNILYLKNDNSGVEIISKDKFGKELAKVAESRNKRIRPETDTKLLCDLNGLMVSGILDYYRASCDKLALDTAKQVIDFILDTNFAGKSLRHRYAGGNWEINAFLDDYSFLLLATLKLHDATLEGRYLETAIVLADIMIQKFYDVGGAFSFTAARETGFSPMIRDGIDTSIPSGNSAAAYGLELLYLKTGDSRYKETAESVFRYFGSEIGRNPMFFTFMMSAAGLALGPSLKVEIALGNGKGSLESLHRETARHYLPNITYMKTDAGGGGARDAGFSFNVCGQDACYPTVQGFDGLMKLIEKLGA